MICECKKKSIEHVCPMVEIKTGRIFKPDPTVEYDFWEFRQRTMTRAFCKKCGNEVSLDYFKAKQ